MQDDAAAVRHTGAQLQRPGEPQPLRVRHGDTAIRVGGNAPGRGLGRAQRVGQVPRHSRPGQVRRHHDGAVLPLGGHQQPLDVLRECLLCRDDAGQAEPVGPALGVGDDDHLTGGHGRLERPDRGGVVGGELECPGEGTQQLRCAYNRMPGQARAAEQPADGASFVGRAAPEVEIHGHERLEQLFDTLDCRRLHGGPG